MLAAMNIESRAIGNVSGYWGTLGVPFVPSWQSPHVIEIGQKEERLRKQIGQVAEEVLRARLIGEVSSEHIIKAEDDVVEVVVRV
jgi:hypothetical protein